MRRAAGLNCSAEKAIGAHKRRAIRVATQRVDRRRRILKPFIIDIPLGLDDGPLAGRRSWFSKGSRASTPRGGASSADLGIESRLPRPGSRVLAGGAGDIGEGVGRGGEGRQDFSKATPNPSKSSQASPSLAKLLQEKKLGFAWFCLAEMS